ALFMVDSAQTAGVLEIDVVAQNIDILAFTGHKGLMGPQGTGGIYLRPGLKVSPLKEGGTGSLSESLEQPELMPDRLESGTLNTPGIAGLLAGLNFIEAVGQQTICEQEQKITAVLIDGLKEIKGLTMYGPGDVKQQTAVAAFNIVDMDCGELAYALDSEFEIVTRSGLHCAPLAHQTIGTLEQGACRISPGYFTTEEEILQAIKAIHAIAKR
ncbi:MAG: aminotransferase class V-fold PLP-dependent enzyme, partial [Syntrophomonadaceae bacterium]|nr:aminotransferase class V-fold PLP-dependent enzyme [Syntrophomonadaceae bacterium]